jgi:hypothetical protein
MTKAKPLPPQKFLMKLFNYNHETGCLIWKDRKDKRVPAGEPAGSMLSGYLTTGIRVADGKRIIFANHRIIWRIVTGEDPLHNQIDHIDGNRLNNKFSNLRLANNSENQQNRKAPRHNTSGFKGVNWCKRRNKWAAKIGIENRRIWIGYFDTPELAHMAYCKAAAELHGEFARGA